MAESAHARVSPGAEPASIAGRYRVLAQLGRGGSAYVYHVREIASGRELALKRLRHDLNPARVAEVIAQLEREFYALAQLRHPRVIEVYDYGVSDDLPYYTMELLAGADLRTSAPLPWRRACELTYDVASSLALLHSRRFVHRDVTPSNIRCTRDGRAKLIDFGAMAHMGAGAAAIGTPAYVAPEVQQCGVLDACTDLFSLGATLYFTLTGRAPFAALDLAAMPAAWAVPPRAPSEHTPGVPPGLDALVLSLLSIEPVHRPRSAFEVMQRLAAIAGLHPTESANVPQGYLSAPHVVGRDAALRRVRGHLQRTLGGAGGALWIEGEPGVGRSRLLELCTLEARTTGAHVLRLEATYGAAAFAGARRLAQALLAAAPEVARDLLPPAQELTALLERGADGLALPALQDALSRWFLAFGAARPVVIAIDDAHRLDEPTLAWLAALAHAAPGTRALLIVTAESDAARDSRSALAVLKRHSEVSSILPLTRGESDVLFATVFGTVPNLLLLGERIFALAAGNPRRSLALAQHLVDQGQIVYAAGAWSLPDDLPLSALPERAEALFAARIARLGGLARTLAEAHALSLVAALHREDYGLLATDADVRSVDDALSELIAHDIVRSDGVSYVLANRDYAAALEARLDPGALQQRHEGLARLAEQRGNHGFVIAHHRLRSGQHELALDLLVGAAETLLAHLNTVDEQQLRNMLEDALVVSKALGRPIRERFELMRVMTTASLLGDTDLYWRVAPAFRAQLVADCGLADFEARAEISDPAARLRAALAATQARHANTPEHARVYPIDEALPRLARYVATSIAVGVRELDIALLRGMPPLLEPFVGLSALLATAWETAEATCDGMFRARPERAHARLQRVYERLEEEQGSRVAATRAAMAYGIGEASATLGLSGAALHWIERLDREPAQRVNAMRVRRILCMQHGDWAGAERARERAEMMAVQASGRQTFEPPLRSELYAQWLARDLAGVKQTGDQIARLAAIHLGWRIHLRLAEGYFEALRGDTASALRAFDECIAGSRPDPQDQNRSFDAWLRASAASLSMLLEQDRVAAARERAEQVLERCRALEIVIFAQPIQCELALAEARSGERARAIERVDVVIADQLQRGVTGLQLGASYEARACVAIASHDVAEALHFAGLAARESRHDEARARHGRLQAEARRAGVSLPATVGKLPAAPVSDPEDAAIAGAFEGAPAEDRARWALELLCKQGRAASGHLYLPHGPNAELACAASAPGPAPPSEALARFAPGFWQQQLEEAEMSSVLTELPWAQDTTYKPFAWCDPQGETYEVLVLYSARLLPPHVGLAILRTPESRRKNAWSSAWLSALAMRLRK